MTLVLVHSGVTDAREWDAVRAEIGGVARDLPGFGAEPLPPGKVSLADTVLGWFEGSATLVGTSFGGRAVLETALAAPERVERIVLVGANTFGWSEEVRAIGAEEETLFEAGRFDEAADLMVRWWLVGPRREPDDVPAELRERVHEMARRIYDLATDDDSPVQPSSSTWRRSPRPCSWCEASWTGPTSSARPRGSSASCPMRARR